MEEEGDENSDEEELDMSGKKRKKRKRSELVCSCDGVSLQYANTVVEICSRAVPSGRQIVDTRGGAQCLTTVFCTVVSAR